MRLHSHRAKEHPDRGNADGMVPVECAAGSLIVYNSLLHHRSGSNDTAAPRAAVLFQALAKYVRPMENQVDLIPPKVLRGAKRLRDYLEMDEGY